MSLKTDVNQDVKNPYPGLRSFEIDEAEYFFGREDEIYDLLDRLKRTKFLAVVGASGCGKSSLIKAGLIATLQGGYMVESGVPWKFAVMRPWQNPIRELVQALGSPEVLDVASRSSENTFEELEVMLRKGSLGIIEALKKWQLPQNNKLLILVDQFEELFAFMENKEIKGAKDEARAFIKLLLEAALQTDFPIYLALTMRSEFIGKCVELPGLPDFINTGLYLLPQMERDQLRDVIKLPIETVYRDEIYLVNDNYPKEDYQLITESLVDTMLNELPQEDQLPLLQHALMRTWDEWAASGDEKIDIEHYKRTGRLEKALSDHVKQVYDEELDEEEKKIAEIIFRGITDTLEGDNIVRKKLKIEEIYKLIPGGEKIKIDKVIEKFAADRRSFLLLSGKSAFSKNELIPPYPKDTDVDISHESLIRQWTLLKNWANDEALLQEVHKEITARTLQWRKKGRSEDYFFRGKQLIEAHNWYLKNKDKLSDLEREFIEKSYIDYENTILNQPKKELSDKIIEEASSRSEAIEKGDAYVFFAYERSDQNLVQRLQRKLEATGNIKVVDWKILPSAEYASQVSRSIQETDAFIFFISKESVQSNVCLSELDEAIRFNKRIIPVELQRVDPELIPPELRKYQRINFDKNKLDGVVNSLAKAIGSDLYWAQAHSRLLVQATEWNKNNRDASFLLTGKNLQEAEQLLFMDSSEPPLTKLQREYIQASREYLNKEQKKRSKFLTVGLAIMGILLLSAVGLAFAANYQRQLAVFAEDDAQKQKTEAEKQTVIAQEQAEKAIEAEKNATNQKNLAEMQRKIAEEEKLKAIQAGEETIKQKELAESQRQIAEQEKEKAVKAEAEAKRQTELARKAELFAKQQANELLVAKNEAEKARDDANEQKRIADEKTIEALKAKEEADKARLEAEKYKDILKARSMSLVAEQYAPRDLNFLEKPETSVLFATESLKTLEQLGKYPAEANADQALQRGLAALPLYEFKPKPVETSVHTGAVNSAVFVDEESGVISGGEDGILMLNEINGKKGRIDTQSPVSKILYGDEFLLIQNKNKGVLIIKDFPDEVFSSGKTLVLDKPNENRFWQRFYSEFDVTDTALSRDGNLIAVAHKNSVRIIRKLKGDYFAAENSAFVHDKNVLSVNFSPDGKYLVTADGDEARIWNVQTRKEISRTRGHDDGDVLYAVFSPNGNDIATISKDNKVRIWNFFYKNELLGEPKIKFETDKFAQPIKVLRFSPNGDYLGIAVGGISAIYATARENLNSQPNNDFTLGSADTGNPVNDINFSSDSRYAITGRKDGTVSLWQVSDGRLQTEIKNGESVNTVILSPGGRYVLTTSIEGKSRVWDITSANDISKPFQQNGSVNSLAFNEKNRLLAIAGNDRTIKLRDMNTADLWGSLSVQSERISSVAFNTDGTLLVSGGNDGAIYVSDTSNIAIKKEDRTKKLPTDSAASVDSVALDNEGKRLVVAGLKHSVEIWDISNFKKISEFPAQPESAFKAQFNPKNKFEIATAYFDNKLRLWDMSSDLTPQTPRWEKSFGTALSDIGFSPNGQFIAVALEQGVKIISVLNGEEIVFDKPLISSEKMTGVLAWSRDGMALAVSDKQKAEVWDVKEIYQSKPIRAPRKIVRVNIGNNNATITSLVFSSDFRAGAKSYLVTGATDGSVRFWLWKPDDLISDACSKVTRNLTNEEWKDAQIDESEAPKTCSEKSQR